MVGGGVVGRRAAPGAAAVGWLVSRYAFKFEWWFCPSVWLVGMLAGAVCAFVGGWLGLRNVLNQSPLQTLREA